LQFKYPYYTPYQYAGNKPISFIDLDGGEEDKPKQGNVSYENMPIGYDSGRGTPENPIESNEFNVVWDTKNNQSFDWNSDWRSIPLSEGGYLIQTGEHIYRSSVDLWEGMPKGLSGYNGYTYTISDLLMRHFIMENGSRVLKESIKGFENRGWAEPLTGKNYWDTYGATLGKLRIFTQMFEVVAMGAGIGSGISGKSASGALTGRVQVSKVSTRGLNAVKTSEGKNGKELFNFTEIAAKHMTEKARSIPIQTLDDIIKNPMSVAKVPRGATDAMMYYSQMLKNGRLYNVEVLYNKSSNTIMHFKYDRKALGPLQKIK
jgi:hypothetical protein